MTAPSSSLRRRRALKVLGGALTGTVAGCATPTLAFDSYRHEADAPIDGSLAIPWPTLGHDARRTGYTSYGWLPRQLEVEPFGTTRPTTEGQLTFADGVAYFGSENFVPVPHARRFGSAGLRATNGDGEGWFVPEDEPLASPTIVGNALFVSSRGKTMAFDRRDGTHCWTFRGGSSHPHASPTVVDDTVYVVGERVFALAARTGEIKWASDALPFSARGTAATKDGVFATTGTDERGAVSRIDPETGRTTWRTELDSGLHVAPVLGELLYVAGADGRLRALHPGDGTESWVQDLGGRTSAMPAITAKTVYAVATHGNTLMAFDAVSGDVQWEFEFFTGRARGPTVAWNMVYLPTSVEDGGFVYVLEANSGFVRRIHELPRSPRTPLVVSIGMGLLSAGSSPTTTRVYSLTRRNTE